MAAFIGLTTEQASQKLKEFGFNEIREVKKNTPLMILLRQVKKNYILYLLFAAAVMSLFVGKSVTAYTIFAVIVAIILAGFIQEYRAEKAIESLKNMLMPMSRAMRNGKEVEIPASEIVPGDIIVLRTGEKVPADGVVLQESEVRLDEAVLTGESKEIKKIGTKDLDSVSDEHKVFMGSFVVSGKCTVQITHTGMNTKFGEIAGMVSTAEKALPLQGKINKISAYMVGVAVFISVLTGFLLFYRAETINAEFLTATFVFLIALAVSAFPEGFPVVLTTTLAVGAKRMAKKNAIVNRMSVIESLGEVTVICTDKTGTVTTGEMTVRKIIMDSHVLSVTGSGYDDNGEFSKDGKSVKLDDNEEFKRLIDCAVLCNDSRIESIETAHKYRVHGSSTEGALLIMAAKHRVYTEDMHVERVEDFPFTSERKMMSVLIKKGETQTVYAKGAPEVILSKCAYMIDNNKKVKITPELKEQLLKENRQLTSKALRTLAFAFKDGGHDKKYTEDDLIFVGITGMEDPPREEVADAIALCKRAGIKIKLITGDSRDTAVAVAKEVGIEGEIIDGERLDQITDEELRDEVSKLAIFVRVKPEHKLRIVKALKENNEVVAMTGDGVNDAPALKEAHIGIAMGIKGTDVSRSVSDIILKDDNFITIVSAIIEGRTIFSNIRKFVSYQLSCNFAELSILFIGVLIAPVLGWDVPILLAIQILFMNLVTADFPALTLGFNPSSRDVLRRKIRNTQIIDVRVAGVIIATGILMCVSTLLVYYLLFNVWGASSEYARTVALSTLIMIEVTIAFAFRSFRKLVLNRSPFVNKYLMMASLGSLVITLAIIYTPLNIVFETIPIGLAGWIVAVLVAGLLVIITDIGKIIDKKIHFLPSN